MTKKTRFLIYALVLFGLLGCAHVPLNNSNGEHVILIHGFGRSNMAMWKLAGDLEAAGYVVHRVGYGSFNRSIEEIQEEVFGQIEAIRTEQNGKLHFVGHSLGGLLVRSYLGKAKVDNLGNIVIMGSPNKGTPVVDKYKDSWWFSLAGSAALEMSTSGSDFLDKLRAPYYNLGVIAGNEEISGFEHILPGADDGLVPVDSTKVKGMKDFIVIQTSHTMMRYNDNVAGQTIYFLKHGQFEKEQVVITR